MELKWVWKLAYGTRMWMHTNDEMLVLCFLRIWVMKGQATRARSLCCTEVKQQFLLSREVILCGNAKRSSGLGQIEQVHGTAMAWKLIRNEARVAKLYELLSTIMQLCKGLQVYRWSWWLKRTWQIDPWETSSKLMKYLTYTPPQVILIQYWVTAVEEGMGHVWGVWNLYSFT